MATSRKALMCLGLMAGIASVAWAVAERASGPKAPLKVETAADDHQVRMTAYPMGIQSFGGLRQVAPR